MGSDDDGYFVCAKVNEKPVTMLCDWCVGWLVVLGLTAL